METIKVKKHSKIPNGFTGIAEWFDGTKGWFVDGKYHREDGPAWEGADGSKEWYLNGNLHRVDGPAIERADGPKQWYFNGKRHRVDGPAWECADGTKVWMLNDKLHRVDGPARVWHYGRKEWYLNGRFVYTSIVDYIVIEDGLPSTMEWLGEPVSTLKVLTAEGICFIPNLPGI